MPAFSSANYSSDYDIQKIEVITQNDKLFKISPRFLMRTDNLIEISPRLQNFVDKNFEFLPQFSRFSEQLIRVTPTLYIISYSDKILKTIPRFTDVSDAFFKVLVKSPFEEFLFSVTVPPPPLPIGRTWDVILNIMNLLKNNWSLTESGLTLNDVNFSTAWYTDNLMFPQVTITPRSSNKRVLTTGNNPIYQFQDTVNVNIWVRPDQDSDKSLGLAKHREYAIRKEVERILRSGSRIGTEYNNEEFIFFTRRKIMDEKNLRPVILRSLIEVRDNQFRREYEDG